MFIYDIIKYALGFSIGAIFWGLFLVIMPNTIKRKEVLKRYNEYVRLEANKNTDVISSYSCGVLRGGLMAYADMLGIKHTEIERDLDLYRSQG